jgi:hypothetical protein
MFKYVKLAIATSLALVLTASVAYANHGTGNPHFIFARASLVGTDLRVDFKEAGLGSDPTATVTIQVTANASRLDACRNNGGNFPSDPKKQTTTTQASASGTFSPGRNGQITDSLTASLPATSLSCPPGQQAVLVSFSYTNIMVCDITHNVCRTATPSTLSGGPFFDV